MWTGTSVLVMNHGAHYDVEALNKSNTTMLAFCFNEGFVSDFVHNLINDDESLLDNFDLYQSEVESLEFPLHTLLIDEHIKPMVRDVLHTKLYLEAYQNDDYDIFSRVLEMLVMHNKALVKTFRGQGIVKNSTKMELYKRLSMARDYIQTHFTEDINLSELSRVACLVSISLSSGVQKHIQDHPQRNLLLT